MCQDQLHVYYKLLPLFSNRQDWCDLIPGEAQQYPYTHHYSLQSGFVTNHQTAQQHGQHIYHGTIQNCKVPKSSKNAASDKSKTSVDVKRITQAETTAIIWIYLNGMDTPFRIFHQFQKEDTLSNLEQSCVLCPFGKRTYYK